MKKEYDFSKMKDEKNPYTEKFKKSCIFCNQTKLKLYLEHGTVFCVEDSSPVTKGHFLVIPKAHRIDWFQMKQQEQKDAFELIEKLKNEILAADDTVSGFNIGMNCGASAGQTIFHCHIHLIPRRDGDCPDPRGGVRGVIPEKQSY